MALLASNTFQLHRLPRATVDQARDTVLGARYWADDSVSFWVNADDRRIGIAVIDDLGDVPSAEVRCSTCVWRRHSAAGVSACRCCAR